jgi:CheY-like chemotaxis protein/signal transduction histidine kinase
MADVRRFVSMPPPDRDARPAAPAPASAAAPSSRPPGAPAPNDAAGPARLVAVAGAAAVAAALALGADLRDVLASVGLGTLIALPLTLRALRRRDADRRVAEEARATLLRADKLALLARVGHELRTPMNGVLAVAELLETTALDAEQARWVGTIRASGAAVVRLLDDLTEYAELEGGQPTAPGAQGRVSLPVLLADVTRRAAERSGGPMPELTLAPDVPRDLALDGARLGRALVGLVDALQLLGGPAVVQGAVTRAGDRLAIRLTHPGARMSPARRAQVFAPLLTGPLEGPATASDGAAEPIDAEPYGRTSSRPATAAPRGATVPHGGDRRAGGAGLGLAITRARLARLSAGVEVDADATGAVQVHVSLPLIEAPPPARSSLDTTQAPTSLVGRVLVVDDNPVNLRVAEAILARLGLSTVSANNGEEAVRLAAEGGLTLILMDLEMPVLDGYAATRRIRSHEAAGHVPIVAMTAAALESDAEECRRAGMDDVLTKPLTVAQVEQTLSRHLGVASPSGAVSTLRPRVPIGRERRRAG